MDEVQFYTACIACGLQNITLGYQVKTQLWISRRVINNCITQVNQFVSSIPGVVRFYDKFCVASANVLPSDLLTEARHLAAAWHLARLEKILSGTISDIAAVVKTLDMVNDSATVTRLLDICDIAKIQSDKITLTNSAINWRDICRTWNIECGTHAKHGDIPAVIHSDLLRFRHIISAISQIVAPPGILYVTCETADLLHENAQRTLSIAEDRYGHYSADHVECFVFTFCNTSGTLPPVIHLIARELGGVLTAEHNRHILSMISSEAHPRRTARPEKKQHIALHVDDAVLSAAAYKMLVHMGYSNITYQITKLTELIITNIPGDYQTATVLFHDMDRFEELVTHCASQG